MAQALADEINAFRSNPRKYAEEMRRLEACFKDRLLTFPDSGLELETVEGEAALQDCLQDLLRCERLPAVQLSQAVSRCCRDHLTDMQVNDLCSHMGTDGSTPEARLARVGHHREQCGENIVFGTWTAKETVYHMLLDDGSPDRGHRANLLNADFLHVGIAHGRHPSAETATIVVLVDDFQPQEVTRPEQLRAVAESIIGPVLDTPSVSRDVASYKAWDRLMQELKPRHLAVPAPLLEGVQRMVKPALYSTAAPSVPRFLLGALNPKPGIDPVVVRAFVHRLDSNRDDLVEENDIAGICHRCQLDLPPEVIRGMFDEVLARRHAAFAGAKGIGWADLFGALRPQKRWVPVVDILIESGSEKYQLTMETEALSRWAQEVHAEFAAVCDGMLAPPATTTTSSKDPGLGASPRQTSHTTTARQIQGFLASVLGARLSSTGQLLQEQPKVRRLLGRPEGAVSPAVISSAVCLGQHKLWAYQVRSHREVWLRLFRAVGLDPSVTPIDSGPPQVCRRPMVTQQAGASGAVSAFKELTFKQPVDRTQAVSQQPQAARSTTRASLERTTASAASLLGLEVHNQPSKHETNAAVRPTSRQRGAGAFSLSAPGGVRGHFHNSVAVQSPTSHGWPQSLEVRWDGSHIDQSKMPPVHDEIKLSTLSRQERGRQFSCYVGKMSGDKTALKARTAEDRNLFNEKYQDFHQHEFRADHPARQGKHGRRLFDPTVRSKPLPNPFKVSELENRPIEEFLHQEELDRELMDRSVPPGHRRLFKQYLPRSEMPGKFYELATGAKVISDVADGVMKKSELGYGQIRHSDATDLALYTRPLGASQMDRRIPLA